MTPLFDAVKEYKKIKARFHMPSHGGVKRFGRSAGLYASAPFDVTELSFSDNLSSPSGVILAAEQLAAKAYGAEHTLFFAGGATDAVQSALYALKDKKTAFLGDMHKSFHSAARLFDLAVQECASLQEIPADAEVVCVTSPDYYGRTKDIASLAAACAEKGAILVVDEAHGAHFAFSSLLPESAVRYAHFVIHGAHKTLPVFTGGAMLHVKDAFYDAARSARSEVISTSPSYLVMASLDFARDLFERKGEEYYAGVKQKIEQVKARYPQVEVLPAEDFTRVVIHKKEAGSALASALEKAGIYVEASDADRLVLIVTPFNVRAIKKAFRIASQFTGHNVKYPDISELIGKVSAQDVGVYPPGVPLVKKGETFTKEKVEILQANLDRLFGTVDGKIKTE